ncbi:pentatricopeptide repeat-containing protein At3g29230-like [Panicum virgatum]|uniref:pentatricopeptide repeat-containing protein At3g29230-like n=1 Tax=Panicum virgatum TaxID=38727 RepID=UPI0019D675D4|nr:pentatricopeptide repeat-containing protein At3g29230-like [Panicum virgatum]
MAHLRQLHAALVKSGHAKDPIAASRAVSFCAGPGGDVAYAERIVRHHPRPNSFMWNTVIRALSDGARPEAAVALFVDMLGSPTPPERRTLPSVFAAYARLAKLSSWNAMMQGLAVHGHWQEAIALFSELKSHSLCPDNVTFIAVLTAYGPSGMPDEAKAAFASMATEHDLEPGIEHYGCLVDALARAGRLREAEDAILAMPMAPDAAVWGALLSGCRLHGDAELGARVAREAVRCDPRDRGAYVLAASVAARVGDAAGVRGRMREAGVDKVPGCSMIEVNGVVHEFLS